MRDWRDVLTVPRDAFVPSLVWVDDPRSDGFVAIAREKSESEWRALVDSDVPIVTQVDDGATTAEQVGLRPTSSCSQPSIVAAMLEALDVRPGHRVLEIGTGTGWNAALLAERVGERGKVTSIEIDPAVADHACQALGRTGHRVQVIVGDGTLGYSPGTPYDRIISTASVARIPRMWIQQTRPGGVIVTPWGTDFGDDALTRLTTRDDGSAVGRCGRNLTFMRVRSQRRDFVAPSEEELASAHVSSTERTARELFEMVEFTHAAFTIGLRVPHCYYTVEDVSTNRRHIELHDVRTRSWARVMMLRDHHPWRVQQFGPRRLWDEVDDAYRWWEGKGRPAAERYGITVEPDGTHKIWLDDPASPQQWVLPSSSAPRHTAPMIQRDDS